MNSFKINTYKLPLTYKKLRFSGRNNSGKIVLFNRGGGHKRRIRVVNFFKKRNYNVLSRVISKFYDPNRNNFITLYSYLSKVITSSNNTFSYHFNFYYSPFVNSSKFKGRSSSTFSSFEYYPGSTYCLYYFPIGIKFHGIEFYPFNGIKVARSSGSVVQLLRRRGSYVIVKIPSGEVRKLSGLCFGTLGDLPDFKSTKISLIKAGRSRWLGSRPSVRGVAKNPVDHPHGGNTSGGRSSVTPWAKITKGLRTSSSPKYNKSVIKPYYIFKKRKKKLI